jgi:uncharacterized membrane protein
MSATGKDAAFMNSYNSQPREQYDGYYATPLSTSDIDPQQYEINRIYHAPSSAPEAGPINQGNPFNQQQQGYMPPLGQQSYVGFNPLESDGSGLAGLCYVGFWLTGLLFLIFGHRKRLVRFHAMQSLLFFGGYSILMYFLISIINANLFFLNGVAIFALALLNIIMCVGWFVGIISGFQGKYTKLPIVGDIAERYVNGDIHLK